ncbi:MAG TPA: MFS transporter, partial [Acidobacteriaceae bacterium]|nr:MFS transporter [Acidobacteriaceae bacterium]
GRKPVLWATVLLMVPGLLGLALAPTVPILIVPAAMVAVSLGAFEAVNWALLSDLIPAGSGAQFFGFANIATAGAGALAGAFGPVVDLANSYLPAGTYTLVFSLAALVAFTSIFPLRALNTATTKSS